MRHLIALPIFMASFAFASPVVEKLTGQGFRCSAQADGHVCVISRSPSHPKPVAILVPSGLREVKNISMFLHGFRNGVCPNDSAPEVMAKGFNLLKQTRGADPSNSTITVLPWSDAIRNGRGQSLPNFDSLSSRGKFTAFTNWLDSAVGVGAKARYHLSGFSAGGRIVEQILTNNPSFQSRVDSVSLLDATYSTSRFMGTWKSVGKKTKVMAVRATSGNSLNSGFNALKTGLPKGPGHIIEHAPKRHCSTPTADYGRLLKLGIRSSASARASTDGFVEDPRPRRTALKRTTAADTNSEIYSQVFSRYKPAPYSFAGDK